MYDQTKAFPLFPCPRSHFTLPQSARRPGFALAYGRELIKMYNDGTYNPEEYMDSNYRIRHEVEVAKPENGKSRSELDWICGEYTLEVVDNDEGGYRVE